MSSITVSKQTRLAPEPARMVLMLLSYAAGCALLTSRALPAGI